jgi:hypothetical protein
MNWGDWFFDYLVIHSVLQRSSEIWKWSWMVSQFERKQFWLIWRHNPEPEENCQLCAKNLIVQVLTNKFFMSNSNCFLYLCLQLQFAEKSCWRIFLIITSNYLFSLEEGGVTAEPLDSEKVSQLCLSKEEALALGHLGVQLEQMFGGPRDIEWALSKVSDSFPFISWDLFAYDVFFVRCA